MAYTAYFEAEIWEEEEEKEEDEEKTEKHSLKM